MSTLNATPLPFVLSIRPTYVQRILTGDKTVELRRRFPALRLPGQLALIYSTSPTQAIVSAVRLAAAEVLSVASLWRRYGQAAAVTRDEFDTYFAGVESGCALQLRDVVRFEKPIHLTELMRRFEFSPPQSYCYWKASLQELTTHGRVKAAA